MIRLIIEFSCMESLSFLWLHPSLLLFIGMDYTAGCWGAEEVSTQSISSPTHYFTNARSKLDLCFFFPGLLPQNSLGLLKKGVTITLLGGIFHPPKDKYWGRNEKILQLSLLQSHSRTQKNTPYVYAFLCHTFSFTSLSK